MRTIFGHPQWGTVVGDDTDHSVWLKVSFGESNDEIDIYVHEQDPLPTVDDVTSLEFVAFYLARAKEEELKIRRLVAEQIVDRFVMDYGYDEHRCPRPEFNAEHLMGTIQLTFITIQREGSRSWGFRSDARLDRQTLVVSVSDDFNTIGEVALFPP